LEPGLFNDQQLSQDGLFTRPIFLMQIGWWGTGLPARSGFVAAVLRSTDAGKPPQHWTPGHMNSDESGWSVRPLAAAIHRQAKRWRTGCQDQVLEDLVDQRLLQDLRNDFQLDGRRWVRT
jgi:hypothetical protein